MTAEKSIVDALFTRPPEGYSEVWARDFRKRLAALGYLVLRDPERAPEAIAEAERVIGETAWKHDGDDAY